MLRRERVRGRLLKRLEFLGRGGLEFERGLVNGSCGIDVGNEGYLEIIFSYSRLRTLA